MKVEYWICYGRSALDQPFRVKERAIAACEQRQKQNPMGEYCVVELRRIYKPRRRRSQ